MREFALLTVMLSITACSNRTVDNSNNNDAFGSIRADVGSPQTTIYHLEGKVDAVNLALEPDGTFHWTIDGCDFFGGDCGDWTAEGSGAILRPRTGTGFFTWVHDGSFAAKAVLVKLRPGPAGDQVTASGVQLDDQPFKQTWTLGRICPACGGLGPTALYPCNDPLSPPGTCTP